MLAVIVRTADENDLPGLIRIEEECFGVEKFNVLTLRSFIEREDSFVIVAVDECEIVGSAMCMTSEARHEGKIASVAVLPAMKRRGIGAMLLAECEARFGAHGLASASLEVGVENEPAISLYESRGYEVRGLIGNFYGFGRDAYMMQKSLRPVRRRVSVRTP